MLKFEEYLNLLLEKIKVETGQESNEAAQTKGTIHELLVGRFLRGGKDMHKHPHVSGLSPAQTLAEYRSRISPEYYKEAVKRAKAAADHIRLEVEKVAGKGAIKDVHWTSKAGDLKRATGIDATQLQDASDIVIHLKKNKSGKQFIGMSLKAGDGGGPIPSTNPGIESTFGGQQFVDKEHARLDKKYPAFAKLTNKSDRQAWIDKQPNRVKDDIYEGQTRVLNQIRDNLHDKLTKMSPEKRADWIRHTVLHAVRTPMEEAGVGLQWKHSAIGLGGKYKLRSVRPGEDWEDIFNDPKNITIQKSGGLGIDFHYRDPETGKEIKFARHAIKLNSRTGGRSGSVKGSGTEALEWFNRPSKASAIKDEEPAKQKAKIDNTKPTPSKEFAGGGHDVSYHSPAEHEVHKIPHEADEAPHHWTQIAASQRAAAEVTAKQPKPGIISRVRGAIKQAVQPRAKQPAPEAPAGRQIDWKTAQKLFANKKNRVEDIANKIGVHHSSIYKKAAAEGWDSDRGSI